jgi:hypothetical protein
VWAAASAIELRRGVNTTEVEVGLSRVRMEDGTAAYLMYLRLESLRA